MKRVIVQTLCNLCWADEIETVAKHEAVRVALSLDEHTEVKQFDLCEQHLELLEPIRALLQVGDPPEPTEQEQAAKRKAERPKVACPECGAMFLAGTGIAVHRRQAHGVPGQAHGHTARQPQPEEQPDA
jgi:hypothetical protein